MSTGSKEKALADEILADAHRQADRKLNAARKSAERIIRSAENEVKTIEQKALDEARSRVERETATIMADVPHQEQVRTIQVKDEVIVHLFTDALQSLRARKDYDVLAVLAQLSRDAIEHMAGDRFTLDVAPEDAQTLAGPLAERTSDEVRKLLGRSVTVSVAPSAELAGGVVVRSEDGRQTVDNSFATRLRRAQASLRGRIAQTVFGESPE